jgi:hypothetical protein
MELTFFTSVGWESWDVEARPVIPDRMPVLVDDDLLFDDGGPPPARRSAVLGVVGSRGLRVHDARRPSSASQSHGRVPAAAGRGLGTARPQLAAIIAAHDERLRADPEAVRAEALGTRPKLAVGCGLPARTWSQAAHRRHARAGGVNLRALTGCRLR